jgi:hypothetical protein
MSSSTLSQNYPSHCLNFECVRENFEGKCTTLRFEEVWSLGFKIINKIITSIGTKQKVRIFKKYFSSALPHP